MWWIFGASPNHSTPRDEAVQKDALARSNLVSEMIVDIGGLALPKLSIQNGQGPLGLTRRALPCHDGVP